MIRLTHYVLNSVSMRQDNIFPLTKEEILEQFDHVFNNQFQQRRIADGQVWNTSIDKTHSGWFSNGYTKGQSTSAILIDKNNEKDYVVFWRYYKDGRIQYGYSFKKRELYKEILN